LEDFLLQKKKTPAPPIAVTVSARAVAPRIKPTSVSTSSSVVVFVSVVVISIVDESSIVVDSEDEDDIVESVDETVELSVLL
jgi:hypothetical protein